MNWQKFIDVFAIGSRFHNTGFNLCDRLEPEIVDEGKKWLLKPNSLILAGEPGRGKTFFLFSLIREFLNKYPTPELRFTKSTKLDNALLLAKNDPYELEKYTEVKYLFIDDFGLERDNSRVEREYSALIDDRWSDNKITVISTNLDHADVEDKFQGRIFSRFKDFCWIAFDGPDLRGSR